MSAAMEVRTAPIIAAEIVRKRARRDALTFRQGEVTAELETLRTAHARALADGSDNMSRASFAAFVQEQDGIARALEMLNTDIAALETEHAEAEHLSAQSDEAASIANARQVVAELDELMRTTIAEQLLPKFAELETALRSARVAEQHTDHSRRNAGFAAPTFINARTESVMRQQGALMSLVHAMRSYIAK